ncbi:MAG: alpha/beta hydrolase [Myxococcales bacterium]|nr:alpha/beta hydrolase [Myxococcales bacterium]
MSAAHRTRIAFAAHALALVAVTPPAQARDRSGQRVRRLLHKAERLPGRLGVLLLRPLTRRAMLRAHLDNVNKASNTLDHQQSSKVDRHPLLARIKAELKGLAPGTLGRLKRNVASLEQRVGGQVQIPHEITDGRARLLYRAERAAALAHYKRSPGDLNAYTINRAELKLAGVGPKGEDVHVSSRRIYQEEWKHGGSGKAKARVLVLPGYQETGRSYYELANSLNKIGCDVALPDQQWAGYTKSPGGMPGQIDSGFGVAADAAALIAYNKALADKAGQKLIVISSSMGAGRGATVAAMLMDQGKLDGAKLFTDPTINAQLPGKLRSTGFTSRQLNPFVWATPTWQNKLTSLMGKIPVLRELAFHSIGMPRLNHTDAKSQADIAATGLRVDAYVQPSAMANSQDVMAFMQASASKGYPKGKTHVLTLAGDTLAYSKATQKLFSTLPNAEVSVASGNDHSLQHNTAHINAVRDAVAAEIAGR